MPTVSVSITINAPAARCFDLARSIDFHTHSMRATGERAVGGVTRGLIGEGQSVTWQARRLGLTQTLTSRVTTCRPPHLFVDEQVRGAFKSFRHEHRFEPIDERTTSLTDTFTFRTPLGPLGWVAERLFLARYMRGVLEEHLRSLKQSLESDDWGGYLPSVEPPHE
jgi:ligand-binding SRPBCC domain-containing protein